MTYEAATIVPRLALFALLAGLPANAAAQAPTGAPPQGTVGAQPTASAGKTELAENKFATAGQRESPDATEAEISVGGLFTSGNARSGALTGAGRVRIRRRIHEFSAAVAGNYARAALRQPDGTSRETTTAGNVQGRLRYDVFFHEKISFFTMVTARYDPFLALNMRLRVDPGFAFYVLSDPKHRLWFEVGYDFLYDARRVRRGADAAACPAGTEYVLDIPNLDPMLAMPQCAARPSLIVHSARLFAGYSNQISENVGFNTGIEYIQGLSPLRSLPAETRGGEERLRSWVNWEVALTASLTKRLAVAGTFTLRYDNAPLPGVRPLDTITAFNLVFRFI